MVDNLNLFTTFVNHTLKHGKDGRKYFWQQAKTCKKNGWAFVAGTC